jgi:glycerol dehydrogenase
MYRQGQGVLAEIGTHAVRLGSRCLVVTGHTAWQKTETVIETCLRKQAIQHTVFLFSGFCTGQTIEQVATAARACSAQMIIAVGGGRSLDTAKSAACRSGLPCITVPTVASTCSCFTTLSVIYNEQGAHLFNEQCGDIIRVALVDSDLLVKHSPARMFRSGIADALAKQPEIEYSFLQLGADREGPAMTAARSLARHNQDVFAACTKQALHDLSNRQVTDDVENILMTSLALTGICSQLCNGYRQMALAHAFYNAVCHGFKLSHLAFLHGELVACGIPLQQLANNSPEQGRAEMKKILTLLEMPGSLEAIGIQNNTENIMSLSAYMASHADSASPEQQDQLMHWLCSCFPT